MAKHDIKELRKHLFDTIEALKDPDKPLELDRAKAISQVAGVIIDSARVEVQYIKATGAAAESDFLVPGETRSNGHLPVRAEHKSLSTGKTLGGENKNG